LLNNLCIFSRLLSLLADVLITCCFFGKILANEEGNRGYQNVCSLNNKYCNLINLCSILVSLSMGEFIGRNSFVGLLFRLNL